MQNAAVQEFDARTQGRDSGLAGLLCGYRFWICEDPASFSAALAVRRDVYVGDFGYDVPVPDEYDARSWLLVAESAADGQIAGTMRITPRAFGPLEAEEYFRLPAALASGRCIEISRFAIRRSHRKTHTFLPIVSLGLFKLCYEFALALGAECQVVCSKPERMWSYLSMGFRSTGITARYEKLNGVEHELLWHDFRQAGTILQGNPFRELFCALQFEEVALPAAPPPVGLVEELEPLRFAVGA